MWPMQLVFPRFIICKMFLSSMSICNTSALLTRSVDLNLPIPVHYLITIFCFPKWPKFWHHPKLCSECITVLPLSLNKLRSVKIRRGVKQGCYLPPTDNWKENTLPKKFLNGFDTPNWKTNNLHCETCRWFCATGYGRNSTTRDGWRANASSKNLCSENEWGKNKTVRISRKPTRKQITIDQIKPRIRTISTILVSWSQSTRN